MTFTVACMTPVASTQKKLSDFGKRMSKNNKGITKKLKSIVEDEKKRSKEIFEDHKKFFGGKPETTSIDFYEK